MAKRAARKDWSWLTKGGRPSVSPPTTTTPGISLPGGAQPVQTRATPTGPAPSKPKPKPRPQVGRERDPHAEARAKAEKWEEKQKEREEKAGGKVLPLVVVTSPFDPAGFPSVYTGGEMPRQTKEEKMQAMAQARMQAAGRMPVGPSQPLIRDKSPFAAMSWQQKYPIQYAPKPQEGPPPYIWKPTYSWMKPKPETEPAAPPPVGKVCRKKCPPGFTSAPGRCCTVPIEPKHVVDEVDQKRLEEERRLYEEEKRRFEEEQRRLEEEQRKFDEWLTETQKEIDKEEAVSRRTEIPTRIPEEQLVEVEDLTLPPSYPVTAAPSALVEEPAALTPAGEEVAPSPQLPKMSPWVWGAAAVGGLLLLMSLRKR